MKAQQVFGAILLVGLFVMLLLYILTSQMISASVMVQQVARPAIVPTATVLPIAQAVPQSARWFIDFDANTWRYRISNKQWGDESRPWHSCDDGLAEMPPTLPKATAWHVNEFCRKYVFTNG